MGTQTSTETYLRDFFRVVRQRKWVILTTLVIVVFLVAVGTFLQTPVYRATVTLLVDMESPNILSIKDVVALGSSDYYAYQDYLRTQQQIITGRYIVEKVFKELKLKDNPEYRQVNDPVGLLQDRIKVEQVRNTRLVRIHVEDRDARQAARIANTLARVYAEENLKRKLKSANQAGGWLQKEIESLKQKVKESELALHKYRIKNDILSLEEKKNVINKSLVFLKNSYLEQESKVHEYSKRYKDKHPRMIRAKEELARMKKMLERERNNALEFERKAIEYGVLERDVQTNKRMFEVVLNRMKETSLSGNMKSNNISIQESARVPGSPVRPRKRLNLFVSVVMGLAMGIGFAFLLEHLDNTIKNPEDIERYLNLPLLGHIPAIASEGMNYTEQEKDRIVQLNPRAIAAEAYRAIRTSIIFSTSAEKKVKSMIITSPGPQEGKTTTVCNLGITMAYGGSKTLIVDTDMRKPRLHSVFERENSRGISNYLTGNAGLEEVIQDTEISGLYLVTCGPRPPNPAELLGSERMKEFIIKAGEKFDRIVFDSPPITVVTDATILASMLDGTVLVTQSGKTTKSILPHAKKLLEKVNARILGVIMNNIHSREDGYYYYYPYYYYYGKDERQPKTMEA